MAPVTGTGVNQQTRAFFATDAKGINMIRYIHLSLLLAKQLGALRKAGKKGELASKKYEAILSDIKLYGCQYEAVFSKRTRNGEARIKNCVKYDLGGGYRLVTIRADRHLFICFVGSHDETNQWIERHRYVDLVPGDPLYLCEERADHTEMVETGGPDSGNSDSIDDLGERYENELMAKLDEALLKDVFHGLFNNPAEKSADRTKTPLPSR